MQELRVIRDQIVVELLPGVIHEINNPLGAIIMNISITKEDLIQWKEQGTLPDAGLMSETCHDMDIASERINQHLQALSYLCGARFLEERSSFDVNLALRHALTLYHNRLKRQVKISVDTQEDDYLYLACGPARAILAILLGFESVLACGGGRDLTVRVTEVGGRVLVTFSREGMKIDHPDERLVALARVDDIELSVRGAELVLGLVAHDPESATGQPAL